jgi:hypothetical protein
MIVIMQPLESVQMPIIKIKGLVLFTIDCIAEPLLNDAPTLEDQHVEELEIQQQFLDCLTPFWHRDTRLYARRLGEYSDEANLSAVKAEIEYSDTLLQNQDDEGPDYEPSDDDEYSCLQNPTKAPIILKDFLTKFPCCPIIHWASQTCNDPKLCFCPFSIHFSVHGGTTIRSLFMMIMDARQIT